MNSFFFFLLLEGFEEIIMQEMYTEKKWKTHGKNMQAKLNVSSKES